MTVFAMARRAKQLAFEIKSHGGKRQGAGRPRKSVFQSHLARETIKKGQPVHVTLKIKKGLPNLRRDKYASLFYLACRKAKRFGLRVIHFSIQSNHLHLVVEAANNASLSRGMKSLNVSFARNLNSRLNLKTPQPMQLTSQNSSKAKVNPRANYGLKASPKIKQRDNRYPINTHSGPVFSDRYHMHILKTPTEVKNVLRYVLGNHDQHRSRRLHIDPYSSSPIFKEWQSLFGKKISDYLDIELIFEREFQDEFKDAYAQLENALSPAEFWLTKTGWKRAS